MRKIVLIILAITALFIVFNYTLHRHFVAVFKDLRPFEGILPVYYKGVKIGNAGNKFHSDDFLRTNVRIMLKNKKRY